MLTRHSIQASQNFQKAVIFPSSFSQPTHLPMVRMYFVHSSALPLDWHSLMELAERPMAGTPNVNAMGGFRFANLRLTLANSRTMPQLLPVSLHNCSDSTEVEAASTSSGY